MNITRKNFLAGLAAAIGAQPAFAKPEPPMLVLDADVGGQVRRFEFELDLSQKISALFDAANPNRCDRFIAVYINKRYGEFETELKRMYDVGELIPGIEGKTLSVRYRGRMLKVV